MRTRIILTVLLLSAAILSTTACVSVEGSGNVITETREVSGFSGIDLSGSGDVIITQGAEESLTIETDDNIMEDVKAEVDGDTLELGFKSGVRPLSPTRLVFRVSVTDLSRLSVSGSGDFESEMIDTDSLEVKVSGSGTVNIADLSTGKVEVDISGSGEVDLEGTADTQDINISGSGKYLAGDLLCGSVKVDISGSGEATVWAKEKLDANVSGSGSISYYGRPSVDSSSSGSGKINNLGEK